MKNRVTFGNRTGIIGLAVLGLVAVGGCGGGSNGNGGGPGLSVPVEVAAAPFAASVGVSVGTYDPTDVVESVTFGDTVTLDFSTNTAWIGDGPHQSITPDGVTLVSSDGRTVVVAQTDTGVSVNSLATGNVRFVLRGRLDGTLTVASKAAYALILGGVTIVGTSGPALNLESKQKVFMVSAPGTTNVLADAANRALTMKAALFGKGPMVFSGDGAIEITGSYKHGIFSNDYIRIRGGTLSVAVSARDGVRSVNGFVFDDGRLTVVATGNTLDEESKGIKVEGSEGAGRGKGSIVINGGYITVTSVGKGITAGWDVREDAKTPETSDDPDPDVTINSGVISVTTTGTPYKLMADGTPVSSSPEGIEAKSDLTVNGGYLNLNTTDDALNSGANCAITGGYLYLASSMKDAVDANASLTISGGTMVAVGADDPEGPFDCDRNTFLVTGGTFVGVGGWISKPTATQSTVVLDGMPSGTIMSLRANDGASAFACAVPRTAATMVISAPTVRTGTTYSLSAGGTPSADHVFRGLFHGSLRHAGGTSGLSFTAAPGVTKVGGVYF